METVFIVLGEWADYEGSGSDIFGTFRSSNSAKKYMLELIQERYEDTRIADNPNFIEEHLINDGFGFIDEDDPDYEQRYFVVESNVRD